MNSASWQKRSLGAKFKFRLMTLIPLSRLSHQSCRTATTHIKRQLISSDNSYQATTHINLKKRQLISSYNSYQSKLISENLFQIIHEIIREN